VLLSVLGCVLPRRSRGIGCAPPLRPEPPAVSPNPSGPKIPTSFLGFFFLIQREGDIHLNVRYVYVNLYECMLICMCVC
jgi:hypothetical protein